MSALKHLKTLLPHNAHIGVVCVYMLIYRHILCQAGKILFISIFYNRPAAVEYSEKLFLRSSRKIMHFFEITLGIRVEYIPPAQPLPSQVIIVSNHQSYCDIFIIRAFLAQHNVRFIASQSMRRGFPGVSRLMRLQDHAFIEQKANSFSALKTIHHFANRLAGTDLSPIIFPEGRLARDGALRPFFSAGLRQLSTHLDAPIALVLIRNSYHLNSLSELKRDLPSAPIQAEVLRCIDDPKERKRSARQIELLEQEYRAALQQAPARQ